MAQTFPGSLSSKKNPQTQQLIKEKEKFLPFLLLAPPVPAQSPNWGGIPGGFGCGAKPGWSSPLQTRNPTMQCRREGAPAGRIRGACSAGNECREGGNARQECEMRDALPRQPFLHLLPPPGAARGCEGGVRDSGCGIRDLECGGRGVGWRNRAADPALRSAGKEPLERECSAREPQDSVTRREEGGGHCAVFQRKSWSRKLRRVYFFMERRCLRRRDAGEGKDPTCPSLLCLSL